MRGRSTGGDLARGDVPLAGWRIYVDLNKVIQLARLMPVGTPVQIT